jgi:1-acyl-sn-glycerol-3-phosphate acyltransferase
LRDPAGASFVESQSRDAGADLFVRNTRRAPMHEVLRLYLGYFVLALFCVAISLLAFPAGLVLTRSSRKRLGRKLIGGAARAYLGFLTWMGACRFDRVALDALRDAPPMVIAPNHPSLLDALVILAGVPGATCIMKADIVNNVLFGAAARLAGYVRNTPLRGMVQSAVDDLNEGSHVLLFPEGTRTTSFPVSRFQGTTGLIAKSAGVPVQTVFIETDSGFLGKGWSLLWTPRMPITCRIRLGKRFDPPVHTAQFVAELEQYFESELAHAQLPEFPVMRPRR